MRQENGMRFDRCIGLQDRDAVDGRVFDADVLTCHDKPLNAGESIRVGVGGRTYRYDGDDSLGNSIFTPLEPFPEFERVEKPYKDNLFVVLEVYPMKNGHFYVWPYVQSGEISDDYTRQHFQFAGEFQTREEAIEAGWAAGKERLDTLYSQSY
jgi:hypothetical protein